MSWTFKQYLIFWINVLTFWTFVIPLFTLFMIFISPEILESKSKEVKKNGRTRNTRTKNRHRRT